MTECESAVATRVVRWQQLHGRSHLPWQQTRDPYRVWLSEIMLQQTQVGTVLDYYARFLERFPDVSSLAKASPDEVLALWSGLGYYSRARNLHRCAQQIVAEHDGSFPSSAQTLATLPGIGRSTAGAIAAFCFGERAPILDANVRRVLTRLLGFGDDLAIAANERKLWELASTLLPQVDLHHSMPRYTQGMMDLGAMVCLPRKPQCGQCPLHSCCKAGLQGDPENYPVKTRKLLRKSESWWLLIQRDSTERVWLHRRPSRGIWAGLHCLPVFPERQALMDRIPQEMVPGILEMPAVLHVLTHRDLHLHPVQVGATRLPLLSEEDGGWFERAQWQQLGLPAPVRKLLEEVA